MGRKARQLQVSTSAGMFLLLVTALTWCFTTSLAQAQGTEAYFNGTAFATVQTLLNVYTRTSLSFRTCSSGQLLHQEGITGDYVELLLLPTSVLELRWQANRQRHAVSIEADLINNKWHDVDLVHRLGSVMLSVGRKSVLVANGSFQSDLFDLRLESGHPQLTVGQGFTGCVLQGAGVVLNDSTVRSEGVSWGSCPLPDRGDCIGYQTDHCFNQPCHRHSKCISLSNTYQCVCTTRYTGQNCDTDLGPLCDKLEHNQCQNGGVCQEDASGNSTLCACPPKYTGLWCETRVDNIHCDAKPCRNGGTCNINQFRNSYVCTCPQGFAGVDCELNVDECQSSPCLNNGSCTDEINSYSCDCTGTGYKGSVCEINVNECEEGNNPCYTGSRCFDRYGGYLCDCPPGFGGKNCDQEVNECDSQPCQNAGTCVDNLNGYLCHCIIGFAGINCEENIDDCAGIACPNNSYCVDGVSAFSCVCNPGYSGSVPHCYEVDECAEVPCLHGGSCQDLLNGFSCTCAEGFVGKFCEVDIDECTSDPCRHGATCVDGAGKYLCNCAPGFTGVNCEVDINDCDPNPCANGKCTDMVNDYFCDCLPGWEGKECFDNVNECDPPPCFNGQCIDLLNNFTCSCSPGYTGRQCEVNINECDRSPCFNGGTCRDLINDFECDCRNEFMGKDCSEFYDACHSAPCRNNGSCRTTKPSHDYYCHCRPGFLGDNCETDIDDCQGIVCPAGEVCVDKQNAFECRCPTGFSGSNCSVNIDECSSSPCLNGTCIDGIGNYFCLCPQGLTGQHCEADVDECSESPPCANGICQNLFGSYLCYCTPGFTGTHCDIEFNECLSMPCKNGATCNDLVNDYSCSCVAGFSGRNCETDVDECASDPCQNGATCSDLIDKYECSCVAGFSGINCEINIDECALQPCLNDGVCVDLVNEFVCNCTDSGFSGEFCQFNIDDCSPDPCQNGAACHDLIKDYKCNCYEGYEGKNCQIDIPECASNPCINSDQCLENSNQSLYEMNYMDMFPSFSYNSAGGYKCVCSSGFTGVNCETNIDDCENNRCENSVCVDGINDYYCACNLGYDGQHCSREIDECQTLLPCKNGARCVDIVADYRCECLPNYGGKSCETLLLGCQNVQCMNGATCVPHLEVTGRHGYTCTCPNGYFGMLCETATTVSFDGQGSMPITQYNELVDSFELLFRFRTTIPNGLISTGFVPNPWMQYRLYMWNGSVKLDVYNETKHILELFSNNGQNDSHWKFVKINFEMTRVSLNVSGLVVQKTGTFPALNLSVQFGSQSPFLSPTAMEDDAVPNFIGCIQDIVVNGDIIIPNRNSALQGVTEGCQRIDQCQDSPCHNGFCKDNWLSYECVCPRPYFGRTCQYNYEPATFGYQDIKSGASLALPDDYENVNENNVSFFLRTRRGSGSVFYLGNSLAGDSNCSSQGSDTFILARLLDGHLQVVVKLMSGEIKEMTLDKRLHDGEIHFVQVVRKSDTLTLRANGTHVSANMSDAPICLEQLYIGSLPGDGGSRQKRQLYPNHFSQDFDIILMDNITFFKGIIHDFRLDDKVVVFYDLNATRDETFPVVFGKADLSDAVQAGVVSDDPCTSFQPCLHGGECNDIWNEYICVCPDDYRGKNCEEKKPCSDNRCPADSECRNLNIGYECVASGAFDGKADGLYYSVQNADQDISNITFSFRSISNGTLLYLENSRSSVSHFFHVEFISGTLEATWDLGPSLENVTLLKTVSKKIEQRSEEWKDVVIKFEGNLINLTVSGYAENLSEDNYSVGLGELLNDGASVYVAGKPDGSNKFKGCLKDVRIGGMLLSFVDVLELPVTENVFHMASVSHVTTGCVLCWSDDCTYGECRNQTDSYECDCMAGYEGQRCETDMCITRNPCDNGGSCYHDNDIKCHCTKEYTGEHCTQRNRCEPQPCENNGECVPQPEVDSYFCACPNNYEGTNCENLSVVDCSVYPCMSGECLDIIVPENEPIKYECRCYDGYEGMNCNETHDFCRSSPCQNNGLCKIHREKYFANYTCRCESGFMGVHCEVNIDECEREPCDFGDCIDGINSYTCECYPGYRGQNCSSKIVHCNDVDSISQRVCYHGSCRNTTDGSYNCDCNTGYFGKHCSVRDECDAAKCNDRGTCRPDHDETALKFVARCSCREGYSGNDCTEKLAISGADDETNLVLIILIPVMSLFLLCTLVGAIIFLRIAKKKRATRGTYSPSRQEMFGSRVEMNHVMKPPPEERLI